MTEREAASTTPPAVATPPGTLLQTPTLTVWAYFDGDSLVFAGRDTGPAAAYMSTDGEYEYYLSVSAKHLPTIIDALGGHPGDNVMTLLESAGETITRRGERGWLEDLGIPVEYRSPG